MTEVTAGAIPSFLQMFLFGFNRKLLNLHSISG